MTGIAVGAAPGIVLFFIGTPITHKPPGISTT